MKKWVNGEIVEMTPEEEAEIIAAQEEWEEMERTRPLTAEEMLEILLNGVTG